MRPLHVAGATNQLMAQFEPRMGIGRLLQWSTLPDCRRLRRKALREPSGSDWKRHHSWPLLLVCHNHDLDTTRLLPR